MWKVHIRVPVKVPSRTGSSPSAGRGDLKVFIQDCGAAAPPAGQAVFSLSAPSQVQVNNDGRRPRCTCYLLCLILSGTQKHQELV